MDRGERAARTQLRFRIAVVRPHTRLRGPHPHPELRRRGILYLLRLAALTRRGVNGVEWTATRSQMSLPDQASEYDGKYLAKYGCTTQRASIRLKHIVERAQDIRIPDYLLLSMERGLRNYLGREGVRLRWHAREDEPLPGNANAYTEQFELVCTDETGDTLFGFFQNYAARLELGRQAAVREVEREFRFRRRDMQARRATLRQDHKREIERTRAQLLRNEDLEGIRLRKQGLAGNVVQDRLDNLRVNHGGTLQRMKERHRAAMSRIEAETPHVNHCCAEQHCRHVAFTRSAEVSTAAESCSTQITVLRMTGVPELYVESLQDLPPVDGYDEPSSISVHGRLVRKRHLSKGLVFGDIQLNKDGGLLEVMIRAQEGILDFAAIRQINWDVHLGDLVTSHGVLQRKRHEGHPDGWLFVLHSIQVEEPWSLYHKDSVFSYADPDKNGDAASAGRGSYVLPPSSKAGASNKYTNMVVLDGFNACKYYFSSSGGTNCLRGEQCHFWHGKPEDFKENRRRWIAKRLEQRAKAAHLAGDSGDPHSKIDKAQRSRIFCDWLVESLSEERLAAGTGVVDIAGGKGDIPIQLWIQRGIPTTLIDPRPMKLGKYNRKLVAKAETTKCRKMSPQLLRCLDEETLNLHPELFADCSLLVGMHPDEATEAIVDAALTLGKPLAIVPCCVMSRVFPDRQCLDGTSVDTYETFVRYLLEKHPSIQRAFLPFAGRNQVLYLFDYDKQRTES